MQYNLFIRSYRGDLKWLKLARKSIEKFVTGYDELVIAVPHDDVALFETEGIKVVGCADHKDGYLGQQSTKLHADLFFNSPCWIIMVDSDCIFTAPVNIKEFVGSGKPDFLYTPYITLGDAVPWKPFTEKCLGFEVENEFMRRQPMVFRSRELAEFREWFLQDKSVSVDEYIRNLTNREFSEFNTMGAWLFKFKNYGYKWVNTALESFKQIALTQYWSWGGVEKHRQEIEQILK